jgi:hypothetical protein
MWSGGGAIRRYIAELARTFVLVFGGRGSAVLAEDWLCGGSLVFGLLLPVMVYAWAVISTLL